MEATHSVSLCDYYEWPDTCVSGSGKEGQKGHCWVPREDKDNEAQVLKRTGTEEDDGWVAGLWGCMC